MHQPPESALTKWYAEQTIQFPCTMSELYLDTKEPGKRYMAAVAACWGRRDCTTSLESAQAFEDLISATMDELHNHSVQPEEMLACYCQTT